MQPCLQVKTIWPRFMLDAVLAKNPLTNLLPSHTSSWWPMVEDIFHSRVCVDLKHSLLRAMTQQEECVYVSMDGTFRICMPVMGQAKFNSPAKVRAEYPFDDASSFRRVITLRAGPGPCRGRERRRACPLLYLCAQRRSKASGTICGQRRTISQAAYQAATGPSQHAGTGSGSHAHSHAIRAGDRWAQDKGINATAHYHGEVLSTQACAPLSAPEQALRSQIEGGTLAQRRARNIVGRLEALHYWPTHIQHIEAMAALAALHQADLRRKLDGTKMTPGSLY